MGDGGQQRGARLVVAHEGVGRLGEVEQRSTVQHGRRVHRVRPQQPLPLGGDGAPHEDEVVLVVDALDRRLLARQRLRGDVAVAVRRGDDAATRPAGAHDGRRVLVEHLERAREQQRELVGGRQHRVAEFGERRRLLVRGADVGGPAGARVDDERDGGADDDEEHERDDVLWVGDRQRADGRGEEPVDEQGRQHTGRDRGRHPADERDDHGEQQVQLHDERQPDTGAQRHEQGAQQRRGGHRGEEAEPHPARRQPLAFGR